MCTQEILLDHYVGTVDIEAKCMVDMINKHVLPSAKAAELPQVAALEAALDTLGKAIEEIHASSGKPQAALARPRRLDREHRLPGCLRILGCKREVTKK